MSDRMAKVEDLPKARFLFVLLDNAFLDFKRTDDDLINMLFNVFLFKQFKQRAVRSQSHFNRLCQPV